MKRGPPPDHDTDKGVDFDITHTEFANWVKQIGHLCKICKGKVKLDISLNGIVVQSVGGPARIAARLWLSPCALKHISLQDHQLQDASAGLALQFDGGKLLTTLQVMVKHAAGSDLRVAVNLNGSMVLETRDPLSGRVTRMEMRDNLGERDPAGYVVDQHGEVFNAMERQSFQAFGGKGPAGPGDIGILYQRGNEQLSKLIENEKINFFLQDREIGRWGATCSELKHEAPAAALPRTVQYHSAFQIPNADAHAIFGGIDKIGAPLVVISTDGDHSLVFSNHATGHQGPRLETRFESQSGTPDRTDPETRSGLFRTKHLLNITQQRISNLCRLYIQSGLPLLYEYVQLNHGAAGPSRDASAEGPRTGGTKLQRRDTNYRSCLHVWVPNLDRRL